MDSDSLPILEGVNRKTARESGALLYRSKRPCLRGHEPIRYAKTGHCVGCCKHRHLEYYKLTSAKRIEEAKARFARIKADPVKYAAYVEGRQPLNRGYKRIPEPNRPMPLLCECCGRPPDGTHRRLNIDHDHKTGKFRGWLCWSCNTAIGKLGDSVAGIKLALAYMMKRAY